jgi:hypothetical protein
MTLDRVTKWSAPKRFLIDTMIIDNIEAAPEVLDMIGVAHGRGALLIVETHLLRDQLSAIGNETRRGVLMAIYDALPKTQVPTSAFVLDVSRLGQACLGDDAISNSLYSMKTSGRGGMQDALVALTASGRADVLVTEDGDLVKKAKAAGVACEVWSFADFRRYVEAVQQNARPRGTITEETL